MQRGLSVMVVEEASARHRCDTFVCVGADHFGVCKPKDRTSSSYLALTKLLASVVAEKKRRSDDLVELPSFVVGMDSRVEEVGRRMEGHSVVALVGMGGVGKTTLSKCLYKKKKDEFVAWCFLEDVKSQKNIEACQRQLFRDVCGGRWDGNENVNFHLAKIKECIMSKKVLVVVDDVGDESTMKALQVPAFNDGKGGSKVILTSRRRDILSDFTEQDGIMDVNILSRKQASELFSYYAFDGVEQHVRTYFDEKAEEIIEACGGLPLSLEVIGQFLRSKWKDSSCERMEKQMQVWEEARLRLKAAQSLDGSSYDMKLWAKLKISFDDLRKEEQCIFLDMACILYKSSRFHEQFLGSGSKMLCRDTLERIWKSPIGIQNLTNRSLIKWSGDGTTLVIHEQLRDMACGIVTDEMGASKSRMWDLDEGPQFRLQKTVSVSLTCFL